MTQAARGTLSIRPTRRSVRRLVVLGSVVMAATLGVGTGVAVAASVEVFPIPGSRYNRPATQITFRGAPAGTIGVVKVTGSRSGVHIGRMLPDSDGEGGSFVPDKPFVRGETVTVSTDLRVLGTAHGEFSFRIADALPLIRSGQLQGVAPAGGDAFPLAARLLARGSGHHQEHTAGFPRRHLRRAAERARAGRADDPRLTRPTGVVFAVPARKGCVRQRLRDSATPGPPRTDVLAGVPE